MSDLDRGLNLETATWVISFPANLPCASNDWLRDLIAAAPVVEAQVRAQVAADIEAERDRHIPCAVLLSAARVAYTASARIARGDS